MKIAIILLVLVGLSAVVASPAGTFSNITISSVSTSSDGKVYAPGEMMFQDEFDWLDKGKWKHEINMNGGGNHEFQLYDDNYTHSYVRDGVLYVAPTQTADLYGEEFLYSGTLWLEGCNDDHGCPTCCGRTAQGDQIMNPVMSARLRTKGTFSFTYGRVEVRARISLGDWVWPAIWLLPEDWVYGGWPTSGEIDMMEARGNNALWAWQGGPHIGVEQISSTIHYGPQGYHGMNFASKNSAPGQGYDQDFHLYQLEWYPDHMKFLIDNQEVSSIWPPNGGFFEMGGFPNHVPNPYNGAPNIRMAPYDQKFHLLLNVATGGDFFPDDAYCPYGKPWKQSSNRQFLDFWQQKHNWQPTWHGEQVAMAVDYVRVYAI